MEAWKEKTDDENWTQLRMINSAVKVVHPIPSLKRISEFSLPFY